MDDIDIYLQELLHIPSSTESSYKGSTIREMYEERKMKLGLSDRQIQKLIALPKNSIDPVLNGTAKNPSFTVMVKLGHFLGLSIERIAEAYAPQMSAEQIGEIQRSRMLPFLIEHFDLRELQRIGVVQLGDSAETIGKRIARFFDLESIYDYSVSKLHVAFSKTKISRETKMRFFWLNAALCQFENISNPHIYSRRSLLSIIPKMRIYTRDEYKGLAIVMKALYHNGVTVIFQQSLPKTAVRGATMVVNGKPCIVISDHFKKYPTLWFALMHELYHVLYDFEDIANHKYHISDDSGDNLFLVSEDRANRFARNFFLDESRMKFIQAYLSSNLMVEKYAKEWGVHPSIIYALSCFESGRWDLFGKFIPSPDVALQLIQTDTFKRETLKESSEIIKSYYEQI